MRGREKKTASTYTRKRSKERRRRRWNQIENYISKGRRAGVESKPWEQIHLTASSRLSQMLCATFFLAAVLYRRLYGKTGEDKKRKKNQIKIRFPLLYSIRSHSSQITENLFFLIFFSSLYKSQSYRQKCWKELGSCFFSTFFDLFQFPFFFLWSERAL